MRLGVGLPSRTSGAQTVSATTLERYATRAEEYGFASGWALEHLLRPPSYKSSWADPLTTLATVSGATDTLDVGTSILILPMRNSLALPVSQLPCPTAKPLAGYSGTLELRVPIF